MLLTFLQLGYLIAGDTRCRSLSTIQVTARTGLRAAERVALFDWRRFSFPPPRGGEVRPIGDGRVPFVQEWVDGGCDMGA